MGGNEEEEEEEEEEEVDDDEDNDDEAEGNRFIVSLCKTCSASGPDIRMTATPARPSPELRAKTVSSAAADVVENGAFPPARLAATRRAHCAALPIMISIVKIINISS